MKHKTTIMTSAVAGLIALGTSGTAPASAAEKPEVEKCYGIVKAGKNDCQTSASACAGTSAKDGQPDSWIFVPKGTCDKIVGGTTSPKG
jgi:uncharacterized membrane protein